MDLGVRSLRKEGRFACRFGLLHQRHGLEKEGVIRRPVSFDLMLTPL